MRCRAASLVATAVLACQPGARGGGQAATHEAGADDAARVQVSSAKPSDHPYGPPGQVSNRFAYIPPQCYAKTRTVAGKRVRNPCYTCHTDSAPPNYVADGDLQVTRRRRGGALKNPWSNLFDPAPAPPPGPADEDVKRLVRASNYLVDGRLVLADALRSLPSAWDGQGDGKWDGFVPDVWY